MRFLDEKRPITIICGHYGAGKTNVAVNMALDGIREISAGKTLMLLDMDIVNPYFRSSDNKEMLEKSGVEVLVPQFAGTNVDVPSIMPDIARIFLDGVVSVLDVGGDDSGAVVLSVYKERIIERGYVFYYVVNKSRPFIADPGDAAAMLRDIEASSGLKATAVINNTCLGAETTPELVRSGFGYASSVCEKLSLPLAATTVFSCDGFSEEEKERYKITKIRDITKKIY